jgi:hypothetical protein
MHDTGGFLAFGLRGNVNYACYACQHEVTRVSFERQQATFTAAAAVAMSRLGMWLRCVCPMFVVAAAGDDEHETASLGSSELAD